MTRYASDESLAERAYSVYQERAIYTDIQHGLPVVCIPAPWHTSHPLIRAGWRAATRFIRHQTFRDTEDQQSMKTYTIDDLRKFSATFIPEITSDDNEGPSVDRTASQAVEDFISHVAQQGKTQEALEMFKVNASRFLGGDMDLDLFIVALYQAFEAGARLDQVEATMDLVRLTTKKGQ